MYNYFNLCLNSKPSWFNAINQETAPLSLRFKNYIWGPQMFKIWKLKQLKPPKGWRLMPWEFIRFTVSPTTLLRLQRPWVRELSSSGNKIALLESFIYVWCLETWGKHQMSFSLSLDFVLWDRVSLNLEPTDAEGQTISTYLERGLGASPSVPAFFHRCWHMTSHCHACVVSALLTGPSS